MPDITPVQRLQQAFGSAILGAVAIGASPGLVSAIGSMTRIQRRLEPRPEFAATYDRLYAAYALADLDGPNRTRVAWAMAHDDAGRAITLYCDLISRAAIDGIERAQGAVGVDLGAAEEPVGEPCAHFGGVVGLAHELLGAAVITGTVGEFERAHNNGEQVVKVVRNTSCQLAERIHPQVLAEHLFLLQLPRDVAYEPHDA